MKYTKRFIRNKLLAALLGSLMLLLCACGGNSTIEPDVTPTATPLPTAAQPTATPVAIKGGTLRIPMNQTVLSLHPLFLQQNEMSNVFSLLFEPLIALDDQRKPTAALAEKWTYIESEGKWELSVRPGVKWHGGLGEVTAQDVAFTINTILDNSASPYHAMVSAYVQSVEAVGVTTVKITPKINGYGLLYALNIPVVPQSYYQGKAADTKDIPRGSGPFSVDSMNLGSTPSKITMSVNTNWWKKRPSLDAVVAIGCEDNAAAIESFMDGELDCVPTELRTTDIYTTFEGVGSQGYLSRYYDFLAPNLTRDFLSDIAVRQAIAYGINRKEIMNNIYLNKAITAEQPIPPDSALNDKNVLRYDQSQTQAKEILKAAGYVDTDDDGFLEKDGKVLAFEILVINTPEQPVKREAARAIAKQLAKVGMEVTVTPLAESDLNKRIAKKDYDMLLTGYYLSDVPNLHFALDADGAGNLSAYDGAATAKTLDAIDQAKTQEALTQAFYTLQGQLAAQLPQIGLFFEMDTLLHSTKVVPGDILRDQGVYDNIDKWYLVE